MTLDERPGEDDFRRKALVTRKILGSKGRRRFKKSSVQVTLDERPQSHARVAPKKLRWSGIGKTAQKGEAQRGGLGEPPEGPES